jgi:hypothetical protein
MIRFNIILPPNVYVFRVVSFLLDLPSKSYMHPSSPHVYYMPGPSHPPVISSLLSINILLSTLFSNTLSLCPSINVRDQVSSSSDGDQIKVDRVGSACGTHVGDMKYITEF